jgi:hypothetical protein
VSIYNERGGSIISGFFFSAILKTIKKKRKGTKLKISCNFLLNTDNLPQKKAFKLFLLSFLEFVGVKRSLSVQTT